MFKEPLDRGLRTAIDPALLEPGELADARNCIYLAGSPALWRTPGRTVFGVVSATATAVDGLRDVQFDNGDQYLIALADTKLKYATVADTGTFTDLTTLLASGAQLERAQYRNRYYLMNGASANASGISSNSVVYLSATAAGTVPSIRQHGMAPVPAAPPSTATAAVTFSQTVTGYYEYWTTEVAKYIQDGIEQSVESTFNGKPTTILVSSTTYSPVIPLPAIQNPGFTTHWRIYRSPKKDFEKDVEFPSGFLISEVGTATAQVTDGGSSTLAGYFFPTLYNSTGFGSDFTNPSNLGASDGSNATITVAGLPFALKSQLAYGFSFGGFSGNIRGIEVEVKHQLSSGNPVVGTIQICRRAADGTRMDPIGSKAFTMTTTLSLSVLGSPTDTWASPTNSGVWDPTDFDANWAVVINVFLNNGRTINFDYIRARVYHSTTQDYVNNQFPTVVYTFGDITSQVGKNGAPPASSTGDLFEDQLVVNDVSNSSLIRFSYPGDPDAFPSTYYVDYETAENDQVRAIKVVNDRLVVWLDSSTWRQNYLPSERDASFDRGKSRSVISSQYGCLSPMCVAAFSPGGGTDLAAFVSRHGVFATDGFNLECYTDDLNWDALFPDGSTAVALINDRKRCLLLFYFQNTANYGNETFLCLPFAYGKGHWDGAPKICGLTHMRNFSNPDFASLESAWSVQRPNGAVSVYLGYGGTSTSAGAGKVWIEKGTDMPSQDPRIQYTTRDLYLGEGGPGSEFRLGKGYGYAHDYTNGTQVTYIPTWRKTDAGATVGGTKSKTLTTQKLHAIGDFNLQAESVSIAFAATASGYAAEFLLLDGQDFGTTDPA